MEYRDHRICECSFVAVEQRGVSHFFLHRKRVASMRKTESSSSFHLGMDFFLLQMVTVLQDKVKAIT